jgi:ABC-type multidrug transport system fused ATPase/permease subunit
LTDFIDFGRKLEGALLEKVLKQANIFDFLQTKAGIDTLVGEGGIQLSGGQKQRDWDNCILKFHMNIIK